MKYYKLTDEKNQTKDGTQWGEGITHKAQGKGRELCTSDVIHVYDHPLKAVMFNPIHANFTNPRLWETKIKKVVAHDTLKVGVKNCTTIKEIPLPEITIEQKVRFAIYCALEVYNDEGFVKWANDWLNGTDRIEATAKAAWVAAGAAAEATARAAWAKVGVAWPAVEAAAWAAEAAAWAAVGAAGAAVGATGAAGAAAGAATWAAETAGVDKTINFVRLIKKAMRESK